MRAPQIIMIVIYGLNLGISLTRHGEPKRGYESFWITLIGTAISYGILRWGGFWG